jgi:hypothetical protein
VGFVSQSRLKTAFEICDSGTREREREREKEREPRRVHQRRTVRDSSSVAENRPALAARLGRADLGLAARVKETNRDDPRQRGSERS